jgi:AraC-like DNA-binding protein
MPEADTELQETHTLGAKTRQTVVKVDGRDEREWLVDAPVASVLKQHRILHVGVAEAWAPYRIVRLKQSGVYFMGCISGEGQILIDGCWQHCGAGMGCLLPPHGVNAFATLSKREPWSFVWVRYEAVPSKRPIVTAASPVMAQFNAQPLVHAVLGLYHECSSATAAALHHWVELIQAQVLKFAQPYALDDRLSLLWQKVAEEPGHDWTVAQLAHQASMSSEHLRRLCLSQLGRSPMRQVTYLRMRQAAELLATTSEKVETIAHQVGYVNPFVFSTTLKKWIGWRPSEHRSKSARSGV